jgi:hypothetical protein
MGATDIGPLGLILRPPGIGRTGLTVEDGLADVDFLGRQ